jgi:chromosome segregation ATPase
MTISSEFDRLTEKLKQQRDEINVQLHLATMEAKEDWEQAEEKWESLKAKIADISDEAKETGEDFLQASKTIAEELSLAYDRIKTRLKDQS